MARLCSQQPRVRGVGGEQYARYNSRQSAAGHIRSHLKDKESHLPNGFSSHMPIVCQLAFFPFRAPGLPYCHGQWTLLSKFAPFATITKSLMKTKRARQTSQCPEGLQKGREGRLKGSSSETLILRHFVKQAISPSTHLIHT